MPEEQKLNLSLSDLQALIGTAVSEAIRQSKKPTAIEQAKIDADELAKQQAQESRLKTSQGVLDTINGQKALHRVCNHMRKNGTYRVVHIKERDPSPGYFICLRNQCIIRPGAAPKDKNWHGGDVVYDTGLFNRLMQGSSQAGVEIID